MIPAHAGAAKNISFATVDNYVYIIDGYSGRAKQYPARYQKRESLMQIVDWIDEFTMPNNRKMQVWPGTAARTA